MSIRLVQLYSVLDVAEAGRGSTATPETEANANAGLETAGGVEMKPELL